MTQLMYVINLLFVPCLSLNVLLWRTRDRDMAPARLIAEYGTAVVVNLILTTIAVKVLARIWYLSIPEDSVKYTCLAVVIAFIWPYIREFFARALRIEVEIKKR